MENTLVFQYLNYYSILFKVNCSTPKGVDNNPNLCQNRLDVFNDFVSFDEKQTWKWRRMANFTQR